MEEHNQKNTSNDGCLESGCRAAIDKGEVPGTRGGVL